MILSLYMLPTIQGPHNLDDLVTIKHKVECWSEQDNKAKLLDGKTVELIAIGLRETSEHMYEWCAYEYNGEWGFL